MPRRHDRVTAPLHIGKSGLAVDSLRVALDGREVGTLAMTPDGLAAFEYGPEWLEEGFALNPFSLPLRKQVFVAKRRPLDGLFGVFSDSLPDGWGRLLVDRFLRSQGIDPFEVSFMERLAIVGDSGMGVLEYEPRFPLPAGDDKLTFDELAEECARVLKTDNSEDLDTLFAMGGSSGGARPKVFTEIDGEGWIVKFPSSHDPQDIGAQEFRFSQMAAGCGIEMSETRLLPSEICEGYFATKRFDRVEADDHPVRRLHMVSAGGLLETSHRIPNLDYDQLLRLTLQLTGDMSEVERMFRLMVFNVAIGNRDDHAKNFSFLFDGERWRLSPAYDLTSNPGMNGEHATTVNGKGCDIEVSDMTEVGKRAGIKASKTRSIVDDVMSAAAAAELPC